MPKDFFRYALMMQDALRGVVRDILKKVVAEGLPGEHHFYIAFRTSAPGVKISQRFHEKYPDEMTIVIQHQYWDLFVNDDRFEIGLSFNNIPEKLVIPFAALTGFMDPSTQFGLQFEQISENENSGQKTAGEPDPESENASLVPSIPGSRKSEDYSPVPLSEGMAEDAKHGKEADASAPATGEVVQLDAFRKKN
jgi:hypothetical protein